MTIKELKELIKDLPDDTIVVRQETHYSHLIVQKLDTEVRELFTGDGYEFGRYQLTKNMRKVNAFVINRE